MESKKNKQNFDLQVKGLLRNKRWTKTEKQKEQAGAELGQAQAKLELG